MLTLKDFPPLPICPSCERLFVEPIWSKISYFENGYTYRRSRRELETSAELGCAFCVALIWRDLKYSSFQATEDEDDDKYEAETISDEVDQGQEGSSSDYQECDPAAEKACDTVLDQVRPVWWPSPDEILEFNANYFFKFTSLDIEYYLAEESRLDSLPPLTSVVKCAWGLFTMSDDPAHTMVRALDEILEPGSPESLELAGQWRAECLTNHPRCPHDSPVDLPTRLVRVSPSGEPESARLCETRGQKGTYCTLSYCWGPPGSQLLATNTHNYGEYLERLPYENLPTTILHAIHVTRSLGLQYLWIDSLCIIQDDSQDMQTELGKMLRIYRDAQLTISAASALSCHEGFLDFIEREKGNDRGKPEEPFLLNLRVDENIMGSILVSQGACNWSHVEKYEQPINQRAWTLQEALLTPRLLVFTRLNMLWRCQTSVNPKFSHPSMRSRPKEDLFSSKDSFWDNISSWWGYTFADAKLIEALPDDDLVLHLPAAEMPTQPTLSDIGLAWRRILEGYTQRRLTKETDKLVAISAIAEMFSSYFSCEYLAGLWKRYLVYDLMWTTSLFGRLEPCNSGSPSWSWSAVEGKISYLPHYWDTVSVTAEVLDCHVTLVSEQAPFGAVEAGEIFIRGYMKEMHFDRRFRLRRADDMDGEHIRFSSDGYEKSGVFPDNEASQVWCLTLGNTPSGSGGSYRSDHGLSPMWLSQSLLLAESLQHPGKYRRLGYISVFDFEPVWWEQCERLTVTIV